ncbi:MAG: diaminopimelate epimerase [Gammaproteobacteria bacterium]|nr:diaminopimelate epimerase [Gammaproteobacteria bacterium]
MHMLFTKMHGLGNDFIVVDAGGLDLPDATAIRGLADRRTGIGFDQLLWLEPPRTGGMDVYYRVFNADGHEVEQCGNGARCIARFLAGHVADGHQRNFSLEHATGISRATIAADGDVSVELGVPNFDPAGVPFVADEQRQAYAIEVDGESIEAGVVSIGNPHAVIEVESVDDAPVSRLGPLLERHERFPNRANIGFMQVAAADRIRLRVFERGTGETRACGTGACAAMIVGRAAGRLAETVVVELPGGTVTVSWEGPGSNVRLTGEAVTVFEGTIEV